MSSVIGVYGMGVMGQSLALNIARHEYQVSVYNYEKEVTEKFMRERVKEETIVPTFTEEQFVESLEKPKKILMMVTAGKVVDMVIDRLLPMLEEGDILIDGGNSYYKDTIVRHERCAAKGVCYFGIGISGGEMGALKGPSLMPSGSKEAYAYLAPILNDIAAKTENGEACCHYIGPDGSGHYVKMVHNGIEYGDIQIICEAYQILKAVGFGNDEIQKIFEKWNQGKLNSYLIEITSEILKVKDPKTGKWLVDMILDVASQKGTGKWTSMEGLDMGVAIPTIAQSVFARCMSAVKDERVVASRIFDEKPSYNIDKKTIVNDLEEALYCAKIISYAQGFALLKEASHLHNWDLQFGEIALTWRQGCIIRARFLEDIKKAFDHDPECPNLMVTDEFAPKLKNTAQYLRKIVLTAIGNGLYIPAFSSALGYYDGYRSEQLPANLLQAQRDYFGAHTYQRVDSDRSMNFHTQWEEIK